MTSTQTIIDLYNNGQRYFKGLDIEGDFSSQNLSGICFDECFIAADFRYCNLSNAHFKNGNIKTCDFRYSNLTDAEFNNLAVESTQFDWAMTEGLRFVNNYCYGKEIAESDFEALFKPNSSKPKFKVIDTFKMTDRGYVICGDIQEGIISIGDSVEFGNESYVISAVEMVDKIREKKAHVGLVISVFDDLEILKIKNRKLNGTTLEIIKGPSE